MKFALIYAMLLLVSAMVLAQTQPKPVATPKPQKKEAAARRAAAKRTQRATQKQTVESYYGPGAGGASEKAHTPVNQPSNTPQ